MFVADLRLPGASTRDVTLQAAPASNSFRRIIRRSILVPMAPDNLNLDSVDSALVREALRS